MSREPLSGYQCSAFGGRARAKLRAAEAKGCVKTKGGTRKKLVESDIVFFGGHHYARLGWPLEFDAIDLNNFSLRGTKVKLLLISSCAGLRKNARAGFRRKFPNAYIFGWIFSAPLNQKGIWPSFIGSINSRIDLSRKEDMTSLIQKWRLFVENQAKEKGSVRPYGLGYAAPSGEVTYYIRSKGKSWRWVTKGNKVSL